MFTFNHCDCKQYLNILLDELLISIPGKIGKWTKWVAAPRFSGPQKSLAHIISIDSGDATKLMFVRELATLKYSID